MVQERGHLCCISFYDCHVHVFLNSGSSILFFAVILQINIGLILNGVGEYELACNFISNAKDLFTTFYGASSLKVATAFHLLARSYSCRGDFRTALGYEKSAYVVYNQRVCLHNSTTNMLFVMFSGLRN